MRGVASMKYGSYILICFLVVLGVLLSAISLNVGIAYIPAFTEEDPAPYTVVIDAGHGGEDGGATDPTGLKESTINLEISLRTRDLFHLLGIKTQMIRDTDRSVSTEGQTVAQRKVSDIRNRVKMTEEIPNARLLSIHQNHFSQSQYRGAQVFYAKTEGSELWAERIREEICTQLDPQNRRQTKVSEDVYLMKHISCPGILVECGFLSNFEETALLQESVYQKKLATVLVCCTASYWEEEYEI